MDPKIAIKNMAKNMGKYFDDDSIVMQFIPIILVLVYASYKPWFVDATHTVLGKVIAILLIIYYTSIDYVYGTLCCVIVIAFYQMHEIEGFVEGAKGKRRRRRRKRRRRRTTKAKPSTETQASEEAQASNADEAESEETVEEETVEEFSNQVDAKASAFADARDTFIRDKCHNGVLIHKGFPVKSEMADHVYSEIQFNTRTRCNPCDKTCDYSIVEAKINTETELCPRSSNNLFDMVRDTFYPKRCSWKEPAAFQPPIQHK
jgi:hypothetical protein